MLNLNINFFNSINNLALNNSFWDTFFIFITNDGTYLIFWLIGIFLFFVAPFITPKRERPEALIAAIYVLLSVVFTWLVVATLKELFSIARPFEVLDGVNKLVSASGKSFPSLHSALTMALGVAISFYYKKTGILLITFSFIIGFSRIFVGVHYPLDVLVGFAFGILMPIISRNFLTFLYR